MIRSVPPASLGDSRRGEAGTEPGGGDDVVAARVTDAGQRVVLAEHGDVEALLADRRLERRVDAVGMRRRASSPAVRN